MSAFKYSNRGSIPCLKSTSAVIVDTTLTITFPQYTNVPKNFSGLMALNAYQTFTATSGTATTINIVLGSQTFQLMSNATTAATGANVPANGVYLVFFDHSAGTIQLV